MEWPTRSYLAECFWPSVSDTQLAKLDGRAAEIAAARRAGVPFARIVESTPLPVPDSDPEAPTG